MGTDEEIWADSASAKGNPCYVCLCYVAGKLSEELNFTEIFKKDRSPPDHPCGCHQSRDTFQTECLAVDCRVGRGTLQNTLEFDRHFRRKMGTNLAGQVRLELTLRRFGDERNCRYTTDL